MGDKISPIYFEPVNDVGSCTFNNDDISSSQSQYDCVPDDDEQLFHFGITIIEKFKPFLNEYRVGAEDSCNNKYCELCIGKSEFNCSCNFKNDNSMIFLGDISDHYCKRLEYVNFARAQDKTIPVSKGGTKFTLHFWVFAYSYVDNVFEGLSIEWKDHVTVEVYLDSTKKYNFHCIIDNNSQKDLLDFHMNQWNFLHCAVNYDYEKYIITTEEDSFIFNYTKTAPSGINGAGQTQLIIKDLTTVSDWGVLFYKNRNYQ